MVLYSRPKLRTHPEKSGQPESHIGIYVRSPLKDLVDTTLRNAKRLCERVMA